MKNIFEQTGYTLPDFYFGNIIEDRGILKLEWNDPQEGFQLLTEQDLLQKEKDSRCALGTVNAPIGSSSWHRQRNIHYSAEYGLEKLQSYKQQRQLPLETPFRPVIK